MAHRHAIAAAVAAFKPSAIVYYGGGFGTLARLIAAALPQAAVEICDPYPPQYGVESSRDFPNLAYVNELSPCRYDVLVCTDVLEHVFEPLVLLAELIQAVRPGGHLFIANCFYPVIACHLPCTFHLRYSFDLFASLMGLTPLGACVGSHARVYLRSSSVLPPWPVIRSLELLSKALFPALLALRNGYKLLRGRSLQLDF